MLADIVDLLACPVCQGDLAIEGGALRCAHGHAFDIARQGYVSLLVGSRAPGTADSAEMVAARAGFLEAGHYAPLTEALAESVATRAGHAPVVVDAGTGTGHYLATVLEAIGDGVGVAFDVSKHAVRRAARAHPRIGAFVADVWRPLPIRTGVADVVMNVFAPRNGPEFRRVLRPGGVVAVVTPAQSHLSPLVRELGLLSVDEEKERRVARSLDGFVEADRRTIAFDLHLSRDDIVEVVRMGPSAWHTEASELEKQISGYISRRVTKNREKVVVRAAFHLSIFEASPRSSVVP
ncbi:putative RNA methyltransferase [Nonomuraea cavernae]|uniref:putative RNA methyltransferase n=1 Tax=Nonomuraea cavernae TaxID=2045107 RepID=UPI0033D5C360